jgi:hypothetical protein
VTRVARSRNIKPGFFKNEELAEIEPLGRILFEGLWCLADREGRLEDRPKRIKAEVLAYDDCDVDNLLEQLHNKGFIIRYEVDGKRYIQVTNFARHQKPHPNEKASVIPAPGNIVKLHDKVLPTRENAISTQADSLSSDSLIPDPSSLIPESKTYVSCDAFTDATEHERHILSELKEVSGYPLDYPKDLKHIRDILTDFPAVDVLNEAKKWHAWMLDHPPRKKPNFRLRFRNWCEIANKRGVKGGQALGSAEKDYTAGYGSFFDAAGKDV